MVLIGGGLLARELRRVLAAESAGGNLAAAAARARAAAVAGVDVLTFVVREVGDRVVTARVALAKATTLGSAVAGAAAASLARAGPAERARLLRDLDRAVHVRATVAGRRACQARHCAALEQAAAAFLRCSRCKDAWYCSRACQAADWKLGTHRSLCGTLPAPG